MVRKEVIHKRLEKLDEYLAILRRLQTVPMDEFVREPEKYGSAERFLQLAIEALNDIGSHVVADLGLGRVDYYRDVPELLYEAGYLNADLRDTWVKMTGFQNVLVHDYMDIDHSQVYALLQEHLRDFDRLRKVFTQFL